MAAASWDFISHVHIRLKYERDLFADFGGATGVARSDDRSWEGPDIHGAGTKEGGCILCGSVWNIGELKPQT